MEEFISQGHPKWESLFKAWKKEGQPMRFTLPTGESYKVRVINDDTPDFRRVDSQSLYGASSVKGL